MKEFSLFFRLSWFNHINLYHKKYKELVNTYKYIKTHKHGHLAAKSRTDDVLLWVVDRWRSV